MPAQPDLATQSPGVHENILATIGHTPLVRLSRALPSFSGILFAKLEGANPGGSAKDRAALSMIRHALETGEVRSDTTIIESSSGNMGIGLALACAYYGLRLICVVDPKATAQNIAILHAYGAEVHCVSEPDPTTGEFLAARLAHVRHLLSEIPNSFWTNQYVNRYNALAHWETMREVDESLPGGVDYLICATSTCGTIRGCAEYITAHHLRTILVAVDAVGSVIFGGPRAHRLIPGLGAAICPDLCRDLPVDRVMHVSDLDCVIGCRRLVETEGILAGGSSGGVLMAAQRVLIEAPPASVAVLIFPDRGERYLETIYSDRWVEEHFGDVPRFWQHGISL